MTKDKNTNTALTELNDKPLVLRPLHVLKSIKLKIESAFTNAALDEQLKQARKYAQFEQTLGDVQKARADAAKNSGRLQNIEEEILADKKISLAEQAEADARTEKARQRTARAKTKYAKRKAVDKAARKKAELESWETEADIEKAKQRAFAVRKSNLDDEREQVSKEKDEIETQIQEIESKIEELLLKDGDQAQAERRAHENRLTELKEKLGAYIKKLGEIDDKL